MFRFGAVAILIAIILVFSWSRQAGGGNKNEKNTALASTNLIFDSNGVVEEVRNFNANKAHRMTSVTKLDGRFSPDNESLLIGQLSRDGYIYISSYRDNGNGGATVMAMNGKVSVQYFLTIAVDKYGNATSTE